jgi:hypothetical protein
VLCKTTVFLSITRELSHYLNYNSLTAIWQRIRFIPDYCSKKMKMWQTFLCFKSK